MFSVVKRTEPADKSKKIWTGDGYVLVKENSVFDFTMVRVPHSGNYDMVIRFQPQVSLSTVFILNNILKSNNPLK